MSDRARRCWTALAAAAAVLLLTAAPLRAQEAPPAGESVLDSGNLYNALWAIGIFAVLLVVLGRLAWRPVLRALEQREKYIADTLARAQSRQSDADALHARYEAQVAGIADQAANELATARRQAQAARDEILADAHRQAQEMTCQARDDIARARRQALDDLHAQAVELATAAAAQIIRRRLNPDDQRRIVHDAIAQLRQVKSPPGSEPP